MNEDEQAGDAAAMKMVLAWPPAIRAAKPLPPGTPTVQALAIAQGTARRLGLPLQLVLSEMEIVHINSCGNVERWECASTGNTR